MSKKKKPKPKTQEFRDAFLDHNPKGRDLLFHEGERHYYWYNTTKCYWEVITDDEMDNIVDEFLCHGYAEDYNVDITFSLVREIVNSLKRETRTAKILRFPEGSVSPVISFEDTDIDVAEMKRLPHSPENYAFHHIPFALPTSQSPTPAFDKFLETTFVHPETMEPDHELIDFIISSMAYYLTPLNPHPFALFVQGSGGNGKSILLDLITALIGEKFTTSLSLEDLDSQFGSADLVGKRLNVVSEDPAKLADTSRIKALISQEQVSYERKFMDRVTFRPVAKHIFSTNKDIRFDSIDEATMRRIHVVVFHRLFRPKGDERIDGHFILEQDASLISHNRKEFTGKLIDELPGIIFKLLTRLRKLKDTGYVINIPGQVLEAKREVQSTSSSALEFMHDTYQVDLKCNDLISCDEIYARYSKWYDDQGRPSRFKLQSRPFWAVVNKNMPEITTQDKIYSNARELRAKHHLKDISPPPKSIDDIEI